MSRQLCNFGMCKIMAILWPVIISQQYQIVADLELWTKFFSSEMGTLIEQTTLYAVEGLWVLINEILSNANVLILLGTGRSFWTLARSSRPRQYGDTRK